MKILICGAGRMTDELLKRIGVNWEITLIEKDEVKLAPFSNRFPAIVRVIAADASSPVVLEKAGLSGQDGVLALTNDDAVNLAIVGFSRKADVKTVLAVVRDPEMLPAFQEQNVWTISMATDAARKVYQFLKDPRIRIVDLGEGDGELLELAVGKQDLPRLADVGSRQDPRWRMVGVLRENKLLFADASVVIEAGDRLLVLGREGLYHAFSSRLAEKQLHFPRTYGQRMILGLDPDASIDAADLLNEALYLAQETHIEKITAVCGASSADIPETLSRWAESLSIEVIEGEPNVARRVVRAAGGSDAGMVVMPYRKQFFLRSFFGSSATNLARSLPCPLLLAKRSNPYERLLVPFNGSPAGQRALEIAMDLSGRLGAAVAVVVVVEPSYLRGASSTTGRWEQDLLGRVRELSRVHKTTVEEIVRRGNPVKEIVSAAVDSQLLILGGHDRRSGFFSMDVLGVIVDRAPCSALLVR